MGGFLGVIRCAATGFQSIGFIVGIISQNARKLNIDIAFCDCPAQNHKILYCSISRFAFGKLGVLWHNTMKIGKIFGTVGTSG